MERIRDLLKETPPDIKGKLIQDHITLDIVGDEVHFWTPQLNFRVEKNEDNEQHSIVAGLIGPRPDVWTLFMFIYFSVGITGFIVSSFGISKMMIGEYTHLILAFPIAILFMLTAYKAGKYGERLADDQVQKLKQFVREATTFKNDY